MELGRTETQLARAHLAVGFVTSGPKITIVFMFNSDEHEMFMLINLKFLTMPNSFLLNIAEHENFSANKYENAN